MKRTHKSMMLMAVVLSVAVLAVFAQPASAQGVLGAIVEAVLAKHPILLGTIGACNNQNGPGSPCTQTSTLVQLDPKTGALVKTIGPVGYTVNGLAWDRTSLKLYASTAIGCGPGLTCPFHGLITINPFTGAGKPVNPIAENFGLSGDPSPVHSIAVDAFGHMVGWYDEKIPPAESDTYVRIDKRTGVATEFNNTGINSGQNGLSFGEFNLLWNIDSPKGGNASQTAYLINPYDGTALLSKPLCAPPAPGQPRPCQLTPAPLGDFLPGTNLYYGLNFDTIGQIGTPSFIVLVDPINGTITPLGRTVDDLHTLAFIK